MKLKIISKPQELLDSAFSRARKKAAAMKKPRDKLKAEKSREITKIETISSFLDERLEAAHKNFPKINELHPFYRELTEAMVDVDALKKALAQMNAVGKINLKLKKQFISKVKEEENIGAIRKHREQFYGRICSLVKDLKKSIDIYNSAVGKMRELPAIDFSLPTIILAGYPNTGKTTLLERLTGSKPKIAAYPFTTKGLKIGYFEEKYFKFQVIDTPGLLDKEMSKRNEIERKAIAALKHLANAIVFVVDPTLRAGFPLEKQAALLEEIKRNFKEPLLVVLNKADVASKEELEKGKEIFKGAVLDGKGIESRLKEKIVELLHAEK